MSLFFSTNTGTFSHYLQKRIASSLLKDKGNHLFMLPLSYLHPDAGNMGRIPGSISFA